jgi:ATP-dependent DNA ligase
VKITRIDKKSEKSEIRSYKTHDEAVEFCLQEENWMLSDGYKPNSSKFTNSFDTDNQLSTKKARRSNDDADSNLLSVTKMTNDAISHRSREVSHAKSDRSNTNNDDDIDDDDNRYVPSKLGAPTSGPISVLLAETWDNETDPKGWIMSEKLDGVRCFWTGTTMFSRNGKRFYFPKFFTRGWPKSQMDGELFIGRGRFSETVSAVRKNKPVDEEWKKVRYLVFDCPGLKQPFKNRLKEMEKVIKEVDSPYLRCHAHRECSGLQDLMKELDGVNENEG